MSELYFPKFNGFTAGVFSERRDSMRRWVLTQWVSKPDVRYDVTSVVVVVSTDGACLFVAYVPPCWKVKNRPRKKRRTRLMRRTGKKTRPRLIRALRAYKVMNCVGRVIVVVVGCRTLKCIFTHR